MLLRVIKERRFARMGSTSLEGERVGCRFVGIATLLDDCSNLGLLIDEGKLRRDLVERFGIQIELPPLREFAEPYRRR